MLPLYVFAEWIATEEVLSEGMKFIYCVIKSKKVKYTTSKYALLLKVSQVQLFWNCFSIQKNHNTISNSFFTKS